MSVRKIGLFLGIVLAVLILIGLVVPAEGIHIGGTTLRYPSLKSILAPDQQPLVDELIADSLASQSMNTLSDTIEYYRQAVTGDSSSIRLWLPSPHYLDAFWQACQQAQADSTVLRVLHYGDSQIEMDHLTSRLRAFMQHTFGGGGPGMLAFSSITPNPTFLQSNNGSVARLSSFGDSTTMRSKGNYGVMMQSFRLDGHAATTLKPSRRSQSDSLVRQFSKLTLIYNNRGSLTATATVGKQNLAQQKAPSKGVGSMEWTVSADVKSVGLQVSGNADLYCMLLDAEAGVAVDNIPMRGCSGQQFTQTDANLLAEAYNKMNIGLIIMQFGGNSVPYFHSTTAINNYCKSIGRQIDYVHRACPTAKILFIGPSDMSHKKNGQYTTYDILPELIDSLTSTALAHDAAYWSIYHAMGGWGSMPQWTRQGLAGKDYIHFSQKGANLMGDRLATAFDNSYRLFLAEKKMAEQTKKKDSAKPKKEKKKSKKRKRKGGRA